MNTKGSGFVDESEISQSGFVSDNPQSGFVGNISEFVTKICDAGQTTLQGQTFSDVQLSTNGAMSDLYRRTHNTGKKEIVKRIKYEFKDDPRYKDLFIKEYENLDGLQHHNIVRSNNRGEDNQGLWYSMEYIDGVTLTHIIRNNLVKSESEKISILKQVLEGLSYIHKKAVFHRDLKPDNIMVTNVGNIVKIIDFGLAVSMAFDDRLKRAGTEKYMSPEQKANPSNIDKRADIYSFGLIMAELLTGQYQMPSSDFSDIRNEKYRRVVEKCTRYNVSERFNNCDEILLELKDKLDLIPDPVCDLIADIVEDGVVSPAERARLDVAIKQYDLDENLVNSELNYQLERVNDRLSKKRRSKVIKSVLAVLLIAGVVLAWMFWPKEEAVETPVAEKVDEPKDTDTKTVVTPVDTPKQNVEEHQDPPNEIEVQDPPKPIKNGGSNSNNQGQTAGSQHNLGYGRWTGGWKNGKPDGVGDMEFTQEHLLNKNDLNQRKAYPGDVVKGGYYQDGELQNGTIVRKDGSEEKFVL